MTTITNKSPIAVNGIFYSIDSEGYLTANVSDQDGIANKQIRFVGDVETVPQTTELTAEDMVTAEDYRTEMQAMMHDAE